MAILLNTLQFRMIYLLLPNLKGATKMWPNPFIAFFTPFYIFYIYIIRMTHKERNL